MYSVFKVYDFNSSFCISTYNYLILLQLLLPTKTFNISFNIMMHGILDKDNSTPSEPVSCFFAANYLMWSRRMKKYSVDANYLDDHQCDNNLLNANSTWWWFLKPSCFGIHNKWFNMGDWGCYPASVSLSCFNETNAIILKNKKINETNAIILKKQKLRVNK
jgi:hypothetical protein